MAMTQDQIRAGVNEVLVKVFDLDLDPADILGDATLDDFKPWNLDYPDLVFQLEQKFGIRIDVNKIFPGVDESNTEVVGRVTVKQIWTFVESLVNPVSVSPVTDGGCGELPRSPLLDSVMNQ